MVHIDLSRADPTEGAADPLIHVQRRSVGVMDGPQVSGALEGIPRLYTGGPAQVCACGTSPGLTPEDRKLGGGVGHDGITKLGPVVRGQVVHLDLGVIPLATDVVAQVVEGLPLAFIDADDGGDMPRQTTGRLDLYPVPDLEALILSHPHSHRATSR
jgi:hypothetical protein